MALWFGRGSSEEFHGGKPLCEVQQTQAGHAGPERLVSQRR